MKVPDHINIPNWVVALLVVGCLYSSIHLAWAAAQAWTAGFEATPANSDQVSQGDDRIRELKETVRDHAEVEHRWGAGAPDSTGRHREGSAVAWYESSCPTSNTAGDAITGTATYGTDDAGRLCKDSDDGVNYVWEGAAWDELIEGLSGTISLINTPRFATESGADAFNPLAFTIRSITTDSSMDSSACAAGGSVNTTALASQTFGEAGVGCLSVSLDLTSRSTTSRVFVLASVVVGDSGDPTQMGIFQDDMATQVGITAATSASHEETLTTFGYSTSVSADSHEFAVHLTDVLGGVGTFAASGVHAGTLIVIDLGPEY